jgi:hypothetical protein
MTAVQDTITGIWYEILGTDEADGPASIFERGGTSISAELIASRINESLGTSVRGADVLRCDTLANLLRHVEERSSPIGDGRSPPDRHAGRGGE